MDVGEIKSPWRGLILELDGIGANIYWGRVRVFKCSQCGKQRWWADKEYLLGNFFELNKMELLKDVEIAVLPINYESRTGLTFAITKNDLPMLAKNIEVFPHEEETEITKTLITFKTKIGEATVFTSFKHKIVLVTRSDLISIEPEEKLCRDCTVKKIKEGAIEVADGVYVKRDYEWVCAHAPTARRNFDGIIVTENITVEFKGIEKGSLWEKESTDYIYGQFETSDDDPEITVHFSNGTATHSRLERNKRYLFAILK